jgi:heptosyltransferase III
MDKHKNILIVRVDRVGDVVLTIPLINIIQEKITGSNIFFLANDYTKDLIEKNRFIKETFILRYSFIDNYRLLNKYKFDTVIVASPTFKLALLFFLMGIRFRVGTGYRWYSFLFNKKHYEHRRFGDKHELEYNVNLIKAIGINPDSSLTIDLSITEKDAIKVNDLLTHKGISTDDRLITIHPGSGGSAMDLPKEKMIDLVGRIHKLNKDFRICITGTKKESELVNALNSSINFSGITFVNELSLRELSYLIKRSSLFISNSTGPIHLAAAVGTFIIGFYPPVKAMSAQRWGPYTDKKILFIPEKRFKNDITQNTYCLRCEKNECKHFNCMDSINIDVVYKTINELLSTI